MAINSFHKQRFLVNDERVSPDTVLVAVVQIRLTTAEMKK